LPIAADCGNSRASGARPFLLRPPSYLVSPRCRHTCPCCRSPNKTG
jgi:hypothetical protein